MNEVRFRGGPLDEPVTAPEQQPQLASLLQMIQGGSALGNAPYDGRTMGEILKPAALHGFIDPDTWGTAPATHEGVSAGIARGAQYQPDVAKALQSSGPEGGWFSIPGTQSETQVPQGMYDFGDRPAPQGLFGMSTNNWQNLPRGFRQPGYSMRAGHIIQNHFIDKPLGYVNYRGGGEPPFGTGGPGHGFPVSAGSSNQRGYFFPGQLEPWITEGGPGTT